MYSYVKGTLVGYSSEKAIVDVGGIGYTIYIPSNTGDRLPAVGAHVQFHTSFVVREFSQALYGFLWARERDAFEVLLNISGIGPKLALCLLGYLPGNRLQAAIVNEDVKTLCTVPGVGKKTAERLIVELRDKIPDLSHFCTDNVCASLPGDSDDERILDAVLALVNLGYNRITAQKAITISLKDLPGDYDLPALLTGALQNISKC